MGETQPKNISENKELSARLMAVQAYYQISQNAKPIRMVVEEYLKNPQCIDIDGEDLPKPHGGLFKRILFSVDERGAEVEAIIKAHVPSKAIIVKSGDEDENSDEPMSTPAAKEIEPLLKSILICGATEILAHDDIDSALIIDDYLNVTHAYYEKQQASLVNGILDKVSKLVRS
ncbi:MAG: transcription antitermination protein NusB [Alphaproteobacteria bacterium]